MCARQATSLDLTDLDFTQLTTLHTLFRKHKDESYNQDEFCLAVKQTIGPHMTDQEIATLFVIVNTRLSKSICWTDFINCIIKAVQERISLKDMIINPVFFGPKTWVTLTKHRKSIISIRFIPRLSFKSEEIDYSRGRYLMLDRDGLLSVWSINVCLIQYHWIGHDRFHTAMHFTDMVVLYPCSMVAVASTRCITFWELHEKADMDRKFDIVDMNGMPTCLDFWAKLPSGYPSILLWGDSAGDVYCLSFDVTQRSGMFTKQETREKLNRVCVDDLLHDRIMNVKLYKTSIVHHGWVTKVHYLLNSESFLASCDSVTTPVWVADCHGGKQRRSFACHTGVQCFAYSRILNIIVMGCVDMSVRVWNSFASKNPIIELRGYRRPVVAVAIREMDEHIIAVETNHAVNVYNLKTQQRVQRFAGGNLPKLGLNPVSSTFYNSVCNHFLMATTALLKLGPEQKSDVSEVSSSSQSVVGVVYSSALERIISVCREGIISTWDVHNGHIIMQHRHVSSRTSEETDYKPEYNKMEVTALVIDKAEKSIVTGASDGTINLWNISIGVLINTYSLPDPVLVSALAIDKVTIYAVGWDRMIYFFNTGDKNSESMRHLCPVHKDDILCMTLMNPGLVASASSDGDIIIVDRYSGQTVCKFNSCQSRFPFLFASLHPVKRPSFEQSSANKVEQPADQGLFALPCTFFDVLKGEYVSRLESDRLFRSYDNSVDVLLFLEIRKLNDKNTAVFLTSGGEGWIRAWSLHKQGGLQGQFCATADLGEMVMAMTTDPQNEFLISADTQGYVKVWDLLLYCNASVESVLSDESRNKRNEMLSKKFVFLKHSFLRDEAAEGNYNPHKRPPPLVSEPKSTLKTPRLLNAFRAHTCPITCITYAADRELIITGDLEKNVRLWLLSGIYIGTCGELWSGLISPQITMFQLRKLPRDLRRCASARTLKVAYRGRRGELWHRAFSLVQSYIRNGFQTLSLSKRGWIIDDKEKEESFEENDVRVMGADLPAALDQPDPKKSDILGSTFKPNLHFKKRPLINTNLSFGEFLGFNQLALHDIDSNIFIPSTKIPMKTRQIKVKKSPFPPRRTGNPQMPSTNSFNESINKAQARLGGCPRVVNSFSADKLASGLSDHNSGIEGGRTPPAALGYLRNATNRDGGHPAGLSRRDKPTGKDIIGARYPSHLPPLTTSLDSASRDAP